jgi:hypothetical protein
MKTTKVREMNMEKIRNCLKRVNNATTLELAKKTGLSVATCGNLLKEMLKIEEVYEIAPTGSTGGRPSKRFVYNSNYKFICGIYLRKEGSKNSIIVNVSNLIGENVDDISYDFGDITMDDLDFVIELILKKYPKIAVIALGVPGVVNNGYLGFCDFKLIANTNIQNVLSVKYNLKFIMENDVNTSALGYYQKCNDKENLVYIYFPTGGCPGSGIIINNSIFHGYSNFAGEIWNLPFIYHLDKKQIFKNDTKDFTEFVSQLIQSFSCIINPKTIVISGLFLTEEHKRTLSEKLERISFKEYLPEVLYEKDFHDSYVEGLKALALKQFKPKTDFI